MTKINSIKDSQGSVHKLDEGIGFPSSKYINLELGASGSKYEAPANGWFCLRKQSGASNEYIRIFGIGGLASSATSYSRSNPLEAYVPVAKGTKCSVYYTATGTTDQFCFIYAQGSEPDEE